MTSAPSPGSPSGNSHSVMSFPAFACVSRVVGRWMERVRVRRELAGLDDRMLRDMGINRTDVRAETDKPFWRD